MRHRRLGLAAAAVVVAAGIALVLLRGHHLRAIGRIALQAGSTPGSGQRTPPPPPLPPLPGIPTGLTLSGVVVDGAGLPVAGALVSAELEEVPAAVAAIPAAAAVRITAPATGAAGTFALPGLVTGRYELRVTGPGLVAAQLRYVAVPADDTRIVVARQVRVDGKVLDGTTPLANALVGLRGDAIGGSIETQTDTAGAFHFPELPEGRYQLYAAKGALVARAVRVPRIGAGPFLPVVLTVESGTIVVGRVVDRDEGTGLLAAVELHPATDDEPPRYARTGPDGVFRIEGIPHGSWLVDAYAPGFISPGGVPLDAGQGTPELGLIRGATIEGRVLDADGNPLANATVRALAGTAEHSAAVEHDQLRRYSGWVASSAVTGSIPFGADPQLLQRGELGVLLGPIPPIPPPGAVVARAASSDPAIIALAAEPAPLVADPDHAAIWVTGTDGRFRIVGLPRGKVAALAVLVARAEGRSKSVAVEPGQVITGVDIVLAAGTNLHGTISDQHGLPVAGAAVRATPVLGAPIDAFTDATGAYRLGPLSGSVELVVSAYAHTSVRRVLELVPTRGTEPAELQQDFRLEVADAILAGTLDDAAGAAVPAATLEIVGGPADGRRALVGPDGTFALDMLPAGPLRVRVRHPDYPVAILDATAAPRGASFSRLRIPLGGAIEGVVLDADTTQPVVNVAITATGPASSTAEGLTTRTGRWRLGPLVPGAWQLAIKLPGYLAMTRSVLVPVASAPGQTTVRDVRIDLARGAVLAGTVRDGRGQRVIGATVTAARVDGTGPRADATSNSQGEFRVRDAPTGDLDLIVERGDARGSMRITVRPGSELLTLELTVR